MDQADPFGFIGLAYDDVMLLPGHTDVIPSEADTSTRLTLSLIHISEPTRLNGESRMTSDA